MADLDLTSRLDAIRLEIAKMLEKPKLPPKERAALTEIMHLLAEAADTAEEANL
jgi:uncharacterized protein Yka (UPF0111/DUF47 family)